MEPEATIVSSHRERYRRVQKEILNIQKGSAAMLVTEATDQARKYRGPPTSEDRTQTVRLEPLTLDVITLFFRYRVG